ncbi:MAG: hypothetical protein PHI90_07485 [Clostridia bacterium]|nr:hypothetical protein [Clostridia bacterium]MDD4048643.1 hypothetical protein [Clostridia bacterium]
MFELLGYPIDKPYFKKLNNTSSQKSSNSLKALEALKIKKDHLVENPYTKTVVGTLPLHLSKNLLALAVKDDFNKNYTVATKLLNKHIANLKTELRIKTEF